MSEGAWVIATAQQQSVADYHPANLAPEVMQRLVQLGYLDSGPLLAREFLGKKGIHLIVLRHLPRTHLDGAAMMLSSGKPVVALTLRYDRLDNFWFTLFHELGHVKLHFEKDKDACFVDCGTTRGAEAFSRRRKGGHWLIESFESTRKPA